MTAKLIATVEVVVRDRYLRRAALRAPSDEQLVAALRAGEDDAMTEIDRRYRDRLLAYVRRMSAGADAEDIVQDVLARAYTALRADDRPMALRAWLYRVAHNRCLDVLRGGHGRIVLTDEIDLGADLATLPELVAGRERLRQVVADIQALPDQQRSALIIRELEGLSYDELATALETTVPAIKSLLVRARMNLARAAEAARAGRTGRAWRASCPAWLAPERRPQDARRRSPIVDRLSASSPRPAVSSSIGTRKSSAPPQRGHAPTMRRPCADVGPNHSNAQPAHLTRGERGIHEYVTAYVGGDRIVDPSRTPTRSGDWRRRPGAASPPARRTRTSLPSRAVTCVSSIGPIQPDNTTIAVAGSAAAICAGSSGVRSPPRRSRSSTSGRSARPTAIATRPRPPPPPSRCRARRAASRARARGTRRSRRSAVRGLP